MGSNQEKKPHVVCVPTPVQGHINPMLKLAKILHSKGCEITFVNTEFNHQRLLRSRGPDALRGFPSFRFETISDGLETPQNHDATQDVVALARALEENCLDPFRRLITQVNASYSPVTCIVADVLTSFTLAASKEFDIPEFMLWTSGAGSFLCFDQYPNLLETGLMPLKDPSFQVNGYLDTVIDSIPTMSGLRLKDIPPWIRYIHPGDEYMVEFICLQIERAKSASAIFFNTFHELDNDILDALSLKFAPCYGIGPLHLLENKIVDKTITSSIKSNLWKEETECLKWLDSKAPLSVIYVNFGSITVMTPQQLVEFGWGLAKSSYSFLWIIRPDLVIGESDLPPELLEEISDRGLLASWCPQEQVLNHPSVGGFLTHGGWNSTIESISSGVPMVCWPFFGDQQPNCWMGCNKWGITMEIDNDVKRDEVAKQVLELMNGEKGNEMRKNVIDLKNKAEEACGIPSGSSMANLDKLIHLIQTSSK